MKPRSDRICQDKNSSQHVSYSEFVERAQTTRCDLSRHDSVITTLRWTGKDTVATAEPCSRLPRDTMFSGCNSRQDTISSASNTATVTIQDDGSPRPPSCPSLCPSRAPSTHRREPRDIVSSASCPISAFAAVPAASRPSRALSTVDCPYGSSKCLHNPALLEVVPIQSELPHLQTTITTNVAHRCELAGCETDPQSQCRGVIGIDSAHSPNSISGVESAVGTETPMTSPCSSPVKAAPWLNEPREHISIITQLDGIVSVYEDCQMGSKIGESADNEEIQAADLSAEACEPYQERTGLNSTTAAEDVCGRLQLHFQKLVKADEDPALILLEQEWHVERQVLAVQEEDHITTPLVAASRAKTPHSFLFPAQSLSRSQSDLGRKSRRPSALLSNSERRATPRQRRLMMSGVQKPDRFVPSRSATPTKETLLVQNPKRTMPDRFHNTISWCSALDDPFGPPRRRTLRMAERDATIQTPIPPPRPVGLNASRVRPRQESPTPRAASAGAVWTVGGTLVTEGVASVTNGRGGRITSGTNAPHYIAGFLRRKSASEEELLHSRRLGIALQMESRTQVARTAARGGIGTIILHQDPYIRRDRVWPHDACSLRSPSSRSFPLDRMNFLHVNAHHGYQATVSRARSKRPKEVPIIPFRGKLRTTDYLSFVTNSLGSARCACPTRRLLLFTPCVLRHC